ncbi:WD40 repeat-like protein [Athelia psychrophila]|uniref:WD40 repeat-like protein n=1 Tax=Athelia psychrophila TaxID=1759441 RepID=A0A166H8B1_9AGAM|nr:WD40 repeat-like protein [Fibularhizoctonia sp. CBS 109695]
MAWFGPQATARLTSSVAEKQKLVDKVFASGFPYSRQGADDLQPACMLSAHKSCVNALCFSHGDGQWLASAGDDLRVQLWNFHDEDIQRPSFSFLGHISNIMTVAFSASNRYVYSGGADETIIRYDMTAPLNPQENHKRYTHHNDMIRGIAPHIYHDEVFMSASDDGRVMLHDDRAQASMTRAECMLQHTAEVTDVKAHPLVEYLFATSDSHGRVCLRDTRMAFGPLSQRTRFGVIRTYNTKLAKNGVGHLSNPESSSINFDRDGSKLSVTMLQFLPTIYSVSDPHPIAVCSAPLHPEEQGPAGPRGRTYVNACTMKHGSFGGPGLSTDSYYAAGSDDFLGYVWKIPDPAQLLEERRVFSAVVVLGFAEGLLSPRYVPVDISQPVFRLNGHKSIVNSAVIHPSFLHIVTAGVERDIVLHGTAPASPCTVGMELTDTQGRQIPPSTPDDTVSLLRALRAARDLDREAVEELETVALFDQILRQEGEPDVFDTRRWRSAEESDSDAESDVDMASDEHPSEDQY